MNLQSRRFRCTFTILLLLGSFCVAQDIDSPRVRALARKLRCDCRCDDVLHDCSHKECARKPFMLREIATAVDAGKTDDQILEIMAANHGHATLLTPMFHGFDTLLWIVPISVVVLAVFGTFIAQRRRLTAAKHDPGGTSLTS